jgi:pyruvate/2-oxoglutarate dehydrogenase complex dihydrolipoamide acyltransferase (E2) component
MPSEFSAQVYLDMSYDERQAEARKFNIDLSGLLPKQQADAIYNAELRRRGEEQEQAEAQAAAASAAVAESSDASEPAAPDYAVMNVDELRSLAEERGVDLGNAKRKADIVELLREYDAMVDEATGDVTADEETSI